MSFSPGQEVTKYTTIILSNGDRADADELLVDVVGPDNAIVFNDLVPVNISTGYYSVTFTLPEDADLGTWRIEWHGSIGLVDIFGFENIEVKEFVDPETQNDFLRARLGEQKADDDVDGSQTFFTDTQIADLLSYAGDNYDVATLEGWRRKAARYARLVNIQESGTIRDLTDKFKQAQALVAYWEKIINGAEADRLAAMKGRVVGRAVNLGEVPDPISMLTPFSGYSENIRTYPTHRLVIPAIMA